MPRRREIGIVTSDKMAKTRRVEVARSTRHPIEECRPMSRLKRWRLVRVVEKSREIDLAALRAAHALDQQTESATQSASSDNATSSQ
jgi:small subunit ribosomal protein S17